MIIDGKVVMENREVLTIDEEEILAGLDETTKDMQTRIKAPVVSSWKFV